MPIEKKPGVPLPRDYRPPHGESYKVKDRDTWESLARDWFLNVGDVIWFNYQTFNPDEINYYLHWNAGCKDKSPSGLNWRFSKRADPGIIYRPPRKPIVFHDGIDEWNERMGSGTDLGKVLTQADYGHHLTESLHFGLDIAHFAHIALAIAGVEFAELGLAGLAIELTGPGIALALTGMALGIGHMEAIDEIKTEKARRGLSQGIVLGAAQEKGSFIRDHFVNLSEDYNTVYPEQRKNFQKTYLWGLVQGLQYGRKLTKHERMLFFQHLDSLKPQYFPLGDFYVERFRKSESSRKDYYSMSAAKFVNEFGSE